VSFLQNNHQVTLLRNEKTKNFEMVNVVICEIVITCLCIVFIHVLVSPPLGFIFVNHFRIIAFSSHSIVSILFGRWTKSL
jgi:hypothetical protein